MIGKRVVITIGVLFLLVLLVFGWDKTISYLAGTRRAVHAGAEERVPMPIEQARIEVMVAREEEKLLAFEDRIADFEGRRDEKEQSLREANRKLADERELLKRIKDLLDEGRDEYAIGRQTYSFAEVNADALERLRRVQQRQESMAFDESLLTELEAAIEQGRNSLAQTRTRLSEMRGALARLEQRNVNADIRMQVSQLANSIAGAPLAANSELENAMRNYERRVGSKERRANARLATDLGSPRIDYSAVIVTEDASAEIDQFLNASVSDKSSSGDTSLSSDGSAKSLEVHQP